MKKVFVLSAAILIAFSFTANAQKFGAKAGFTMSRYLFSQEANDLLKDNQKMHMGFNVGLVGEMPLGELFSLRGDLSFVQLGGKFEYETSAGIPGFSGKVNIDSKSNVNYLQLQVSPKINFDPLYLFVGPYFGYAMGGKEKVKTKGTADVLGIKKEIENEDEDKLFEDDHNLNRMDVGANLGIGANFNGVIVEANVGMGFINFEKDKETTLGTVKGDMKNFFFGISVGYLLGK